MPNEQPFTRDLADALKAEFQAVVASGDQQATVRFARMDLVLSKAPDGGFLLRTSGMESGHVARLCPAAPTPPAWYPQRMPFIPMELATIEESLPDDIVVTWFTPQNPDALVASLLEESTHDGWGTIARKHPDPSVRPPNQYRLSKGEAIRLIIVTDSTITLVQKSKGLAGRR